MPILVISEARFIGSTAMHDFNHDVVNGGALTYATYLSSIDPIRRIYNCVIGMANFRNRKKTSDVVSRHGRRAHSDLITIVADRPCLERRYAISVTKTQTGISWRALKSFETDVAKTVRGFIDSRTCWPSLRNIVYLDRWFGVIPTSANKGAGERAAV
jgi:dTDP-D-glucose 4,6-dehydratase